MNIERKREFVPARFAVPGICFLLAAMVWAVYGQTLRHGFVSYDDSVYVYENAVVKRGLTLHGIARAFAYGGIGHWHPATWISHMLDCQLYGLWPGGHHLTNVLLHGASAILLFVALRRMTRTLWRSAFVAAVFAVHPLHVESVAWVAERKDVLSGLFFMLTLLAYARYAHGPRSFSRYLPVVVLFAVGLMSKNMLVTMPFVLLLLDYWPLCRWKPYAGAGNSSQPLSRLVIEKIPLFTLSLASCVITSMVPEKLAAIDQMPFRLRLENAVVCCVIYLRQMVWPAGLAAPYPNPAAYLPPGEVLAAVALLAAISIAAFLFGKKQPWIAVGWLWYLGMLIPVIGIVQISTYAHADRYTYLPQIGLYIAVAWVAAEACARLRHGRLLMGVLSAAIFAGLMSAAHLQTSYWKDSGSLWSHTLAVMPGNAAAHNNLGLVLEENGQMDAAISHYEEAIKSQPNLAKARVNLGNALLREDRSAEAIGQFQDALEIDPLYAEAQNSLGKAFMKNGDAGGAIAHYENALKMQPHDVDILCNLGSALLSNGRLDEAAACFQQALKIQPDAEAACYNLGMVLQQLGRYDEAAALFRRALAIQPLDAEAHISLGNLLLKQGAVDEAINHFEKAVATQPALAKAHSNLAVALVQQGRIDEAIAHLQRAIEIEPGFAKARSNLGVMLLRKGRLDEAVAQFQEALKIQPDYAEAQYNIGLALENKGQTSEAIAHFRRALEIQPGYTDAQNSLDRALAAHPQK